MFLLVRVSITNSHAVTHSFIIDAVVVINRPEERCQPKEPLPVTSLFETAMLICSRVLKLIDLSTSLLLTKLSFPLALFIGNVLYLWSLITYTGTAKDSFSLRWCLPSPFDLCRNGGMRSCLFISIILHACA